VRASRVLEQSLWYRIDFRWLAQGLLIDHSTLSEFRRKNGEELKDLFVQIVMIAHKMGLVCFTQLAFDGTRIRASNHRHRTRTPAELRTLQEELSKKFDEYLQQAQQEEDSQQLMATADSELPEKLSDTKRRLAHITKAMEDRKITLCSPLKGESKTPNPAIREELSEPVPAEKESDLPTRLISKKKNTPSVALRASVPSAASSSTSGCVNFCCVVWIA